MILRPMLLIIAVALTALISSPVIGAGRPPLRHDLLRSSDCADGPTPMHTSLTGRVRARSAGPDRIAHYPSLIWPLDRRVRDGVIVGYYVDDDTTSAISDYEGGTWSYNGHNGTDISLEDFRAMDRGVAVRAAAAGAVVAGQADRFDRGCGPPWPDEGNFLAIKHEDHTYAFYYHLRTASVTTGLNESVQAGHVLGFVGSSGNSNGPHLHFEMGDFLDLGNYHPRDPWQGAYNTEPGLWRWQEPYAGAQPFWTGSATGDHATRTGGRRQRRGLLRPRAGGR